MAVQSPEDIELRDKLALMVERAKDADAGVAKAALDSMRCVAGKPATERREARRPLCCPRARAANALIRCRCAETRSARPRAR